MKKENIVSLAVGLVVIFGTTYLISRAWKIGQKEKRKPIESSVSDEEIEIK